MSGDICDYTPQGQPMYQRDNTDIKGQKLWTQITRGNKEISTHEAL